MLRKTNYSRTENNNYDYNGRILESNNINIAPKLKPSGFKKSDVNLNNNYNNTMTTNENSSSNTTNLNTSTGTYIEEEIAPGVTLSGYAYNI